MARASLPYLLASHASSEAQTSGFEWKGLSSVNTTLTIETVRNAMRKIMPLLSYELRGSEFVPSGTYYVVNRRLLDPDQVFPDLPRSPLVICHKCEEDSVHAHIAYNPKSVVDASDPKPRPIPLLRPWIEWVPCV